jgi:alkanesulfonate monooxygenase SsuD/methylene tetrahydromethanopterin reductase-like flavin-dependent oxidoreductase (luciferase family)
MSLRHPTTLAHALATIDVISKGRLRIAASAGPVAEYMSRQFAACGVPPGEKAGRLSETIAVVRRLWAEERITFEGRYFRIENAGILPKPVQKPAVPIWIATGGAPAEAALKRVARIGDGWVSTGPTATDFAVHRRAIDGFAAGYGRSPADVATSLLFAAVRCETDGDLARREGWNWMVSFFRRPREDLEGTFTPIFGTPKECARELSAYAKAGMTGLIARIASDDLAGQTETLLTNVRPAVGKVA